VPAMGDSVNAASNVTATNMTLPQNGDGLGLDNKCSRRLVIWPVAG
jgi:hypothetical protein